VHRAARATDSELPAAAPAQKNKKRIKQQNVCIDRHRKIDIDIDRQFDR